MTKRLSWPTSVGCEGGPVLLADAKDFGWWTGTHALPPERRTRLHYWGQFTGELPEPWKRDGGHVWVEGETPGQLRSKLEELIAVVERTFPDVKITRDDEAGQVRGLLPDRRQICMELAPKSEYDAAWQSNRGAEAWMHWFGDGAKALFWEVEGGGIVDVGLDANRSEIVLLRTWVDEKEDENRIKALLDKPHEVEEPADVEIDIPTGVVVVIWSPTASIDLEGVEDLKALIAMADREPPARLGTGGIEGLGTVFRVEPGRYRAHVAALEEDDWSCRWCRLTWAG